MQEPKSRLLIPTYEMPWPVDCPAPVYRAGQLSYAHMSDMSPYSHSSSNSILWAVSYLHGRRLLSSRAGGRTARTKS